MMLNKKLVATAMVVCLALSATVLASCSKAAAPPQKSKEMPLGVQWMTGYKTAKTPAQYNKVGVLKVGYASAKNVLVLEPGTSAGSAYFVPLAQWIVSKEPGWQVWAVERRENLLEDQSVINLAKEKKASAEKIYDYYLGYLKNPKIKDHVKLPSTKNVEFAKTWGMNVAVGDLHVVITAAEKLGGKVVLGGHSLGGSVVTAYATWDFGGKPGADGLSGLIYDTGGSSPAPMTAAQASTELATLDASTKSPWLSFGGIPAPYAGIFSATGSLAALLYPTTPSLGQASGLLPATIVPPVRVTNAGQYGFALNVTTSPMSLMAAQGHIGKGVTPKGPIHGWDGKGAITPLDRFATMFSGYPIQTVTGTEWYFPQRLTDDTGVVDNGNANPGQTVLGVDATMGHQLPKTLLIYAFGAALGGPAVPADAKLLASQSGIPTSNLTLVTEHTTYSHNDPAGAYPKNIFFNDLLPFLNKAATT